MNKQECEEKKYECWLDTANFCGFSTRDDIKHSAFDAAFDRAYELGKQFGNSEQLTVEKTVISGWVARDKDGDVPLFVEEGKPYRNKYGEFIGCPTLYLPRNKFPDIISDRDPIEVEIIIKRKKNELV